jgi:predicted O-methyltransferase YrrM
MRTRDWDDIRRSVECAVQRLGAETHCELVRAPSVGAAARFAEGSLDLVHVDGNHDRAAVERDVVLYTARLRGGGFLVLDDASWPTIRPVYRELEQRASRVFEIFDLPGGDDFAVFRMPGG